MLEQQIGKNFINLIRTDRAVTVPKVQLICADTVRERLPFGWLLLGWLASRDDLRENPSGGRTAR
jgi:hypothetical protein